MVCSHLGLDYITSALAGLNVSLVVGKLGLAGAVFGTGTMMILSIVATSTAYKIAEHNGFNPSDEHAARHKKAKLSSKSEVGLIAKASSLFRRVPTLWALFIEVLSSQGLATLLNVCFVVKLRLLPFPTTEIVRGGWGSFLPSSMSLP
jgi:hypothetical protein